MKLSNEKIEVTFTSLGAEVIEIRAYDEIITHDRDPKYWGRNAPVLFPIIGSLIDSKYNVDGEEFSLSQHGFARDQEFSVDEHLENSITFKLVSCDETLLVYPYQFELYIKYDLNDNELKTSYKIVNKSNCEMLYQIGAHPAYKVELNADYTFSMNNQGNKHGLVGPFIGEGSPYINQNLKLTDELLKDGALVYNISSGEHLVSILKNNRPYITMEFTDFNQFGLWSPEGKHAPFVCLEPWSGCADMADRRNNNFKDKDFINTLSINNSRTFSFITKYFKK